MPQNPEGHIPTAKPKNRDTEKGGKQQPAAEPTICTNVRHGTHSKLPPQQPLRSNQFGHGQDPNRHAGYRQESWIHRQLKNPTHDAASRMEKCPPGRKLTIPICNGMPSNQPLIKQSAACHTYPASSNLTTTTMVQDCQPGLCNDLSHKHCQLGQERLHFRSNITSTGILHALLAEIFSTLRF